MSFDITRQSLFRTLLYFVLLAVVFWGGEFISTDRAEVAKVTHLEYQTTDFGTPLGTSIDRLLKESPVTGVVLATLLVFINAFMVIRIVLRNVIFLERSYMPLIIYLLISSGYYNSYLSFRPLLVTLILIIACEILFRSYNDKGLASGRYLSFGFMIGIAGAIYAPALLYVILLPIALATFRLPDIREWISSLVGWMLPLFFSGYIPWLAGADFSEVYTRLWVAMTTEINLPSLGEFNVIDWTFFGCIALLTVMAIVAFVGRRSFFKPKQIKAYWFMIWIFTITLAIILLAPCGSLLMLPIAALPLAVIIPTYFSSRNPNFITNFIYVLMVGCALMIHLLPLVR